MSLSSGKEDSDHYLNYKSKLGKNTQMQQKKLKIVEKEKARRPKKVYKGNRKKERSRTRIHSRVLPWRGFLSSESTSSDSITGLKHVCLYL